MDRLLDSPAAFGRWLRSDSDPVPPDVAASVISAHPRRRLIVVGRPGRALPPADVLAAALRPSLPWLADEAALFLWASEHPSERGLAQRVADLLAVAVRVQHGLPVLDQNAEPVVATIDRTGAPTWQPFVTVSRYLPAGNGAELQEWHPPVPWLVPAGPGTYTLCAGWVLDVVPAGAVVRPATVPPAAAHRSLTCHPDWVVLILDSDATGGIPDAVLAALGRLTDNLPFPARFRLRLLHTPRVSARAATALRWAVPAPARAWSRYVSAPPVEPAPTTSHPVPGITTAGSRAERWTRDGPRLEVRLVEGRLVSGWSDERREPRPRAGA